MSGFTNDLSLSIEVLPDFLSNSTIDCDGHEVSYDRGSRIRIIFERNCNRTYNACVMHSLILSFPPCFRRPARRIQSLDIFLTADNSCGKCFLDNKTQLDLTEP
jgi:hypothetical protein